MTDWQIPVKTAWMKTQESHEPSMSYAKDIHKVASLLEDFTALEVGSAWGLSTLAILEAGAKSLVSVDPNLNAEGANEAKANGYGDRYSWTVTRSDTFWRENENVSYDLIYIDGSHLYEDVRNDLYEAWKRLNKDGLLLLDDWDHAKNRVSEGEFSEYGVSLAAFEFWRDHHDEITDVDICGRVLWFKK